MRNPEGHTLNELLVDPTLDNISKRSLLDNLKEFEVEYGAEFEQNLYRGRERLWRYKDTTFSILKQTTDDIEIIRKSIEKLILFKGDPRYDLLRFYLMGLEKGVTENGMSFMSFDNNSEVVGLEHIEIILDAIINRYPLKILYRSFEGKEFESNIHPYHLRQYNRRWTLFAYSEDKCDIYNYPLDRIVSLEHLSKDYIPTNIDFDEYFDDIVGITNYKNRDVEKIVLKVNKRSIDYIRTKPLHHTQKELHELEDDDSVCVQIEVKLNRELSMLILSYGDAIEVLSPTSLRKEISEIAERMNAVYNKL